MTYGEVYQAADAADAVYAKALAAWAAKAVAYDAAKDADDADGATMDAAYEEAKAAEVALEAAAEDKLEADMAKHYAKDAWIVNVAAAVTRGDPRSAVAKSQPRRGRRVRVVSAESEAKLEVESKGSIWRELFPDECDNIYCTICRGK